MKTGPLRFLIADDHEIVRRGLRQLLEDVFPGAVFGAAADAATALQLAWKEPWDLAIFDINMPGRNGLEALAELRKTCPKLPVLMLSMAPESEYAVRALKLGAAGYVTKQSVGAELVRAVQAILAGNRYITAALADRLATVVQQGEAGPIHARLSERELQVLKLLARGRNVKEIAVELALGEKTIFTYRTRLLNKLGLHNDVEAARYALQHHLVE
jgi:DNA-binding NarL/FixJ family response regulator